MSAVCLPLDETLRDGQWHERSVSHAGRHYSLMIRYADRQWQAYLNVCPHQGRRMDYAPDQFLLSPSGTLICPAHGAEFRTEDGFCINGPCRGARLQPVALREDNTNASLLIAADSLPAS
jgi:nitrite reductase/ring-hydroxylating ferredoxin subunit